MAASIAPTTVTHYDVAGATLAEVVAALSGREEAGDCRWDLSFRYDSVNSRGLPVGLVVEGTMTIEMPRWTGYASAPAAHQSEWDRFYRVLRDHEDGHDTRARAAADTMQDLLRRTPASRLSAKFTDQLAKIQQVSDAYDLATNHGMRPPPGTIITIPP